MVLYTCNTRKKKYPVVDHVFPNQIWSNGIIKIQGIYPTLRHTHIVPYSRLPRLRWYFSWKMLKVWHNPSPTQNQSQNPSDFFLRGLYKSLCMVLKISILAGYMGQLPIFFGNPSVKSGQSPGCINPQRRSRVISYGHYGHPVAG